MLERFFPKSVGSGYRKRLKNLYPDRGPGNQDLDYSHPISWALRFPNPADFAHTNKTHWKARDPVHSPIDKPASASFSIEVRLSPIFRLPLHAGLLGLVAGL